MEATMVAKGADHIGITDTDLVTIGNSSLSGNAFTDKTYTDFPELALFTNITELPARSFCSHI
jgi:hypothetical protein